MEILSPAGSPDSLVASIKGGCNAVYLGGKAFGARAFSPNFTDAQLEGAVNYAHDRKVKVYVTVNTLVKDTELEEAISFVKFLDDIGADAILIQDLGLLRAIDRFDIHKHASTQMGIHTASGLEWCAANGLDRAVLSRELTFDELSKIVPSSPVETEVFVQGAMCYCISGGCLFSGLVGGRSGNRGQCAQPCRKRYKHGNRDGFIMSCADIYGVEWLQKLDRLGVTSAKIEGRMRSQAYAYLATKDYVCMMDGDPRLEFAENDDLLKTVFNRGHCPGYFAGVESPVQMKYADNRGYLLGEVTIKDKRFTTNDLSEKANVKDGISIFRGDDKMGGFKLSGIGNVSVPFKIPDGRYEIYRTYDPRIDTIKNMVGSAPKLNGKTQRTTITLNARQVDRPVKTRLELSFYVNSIKNLEAVIDKADRIYFDLNDHVKEARAICEKKGREFVINMPRLYPDGDMEGLDRRAIMIHSPGEVPFAKGQRVYGSYHTNMFNHLVPESYYQTTLSVELSKKEIETIAKSYSGRLEVMAFGRTELMCTRDPAMGNGIMVDEKGFEFPVYKDGKGLSHILNSSDLMLLPYLNEIRKMGIESVGIDVRKRPTSLASYVADACGSWSLSKKNKLTEMCGGINYGAYLRGMD